METFVMLYLLYVSRCHPLYIVETKNIYGSRKKELIKEVHRYCQQKNRNCLWISDEINERFKLKFLFSFTVWVEQ